MKRTVITIVIGGLLSFAGIATLLVPHGAWVESWVRWRASAATAAYYGPYSNQPLALSWDQSKLAVVNPEAGTVTIFQVAGDANTKTTEVTVGKQPAGVAWSADGSTLYVANQGDGTVSVVSLGQAYQGGYQQSTTIAVGTEPHGMVLSASGQKLYVTNTRSSNVSVINTTTNTVTATITGVGPEPRGIAITHGPNITTDSLQTVYVTDFLALPSGNGHPDGFDDAKTGFVTAISVANDTVTSTIKLNTVADTGFKAAGDALNHIAAPANPQPTDFTFTTGAYPNQLNNLATHGNFLYLPNTAASPNGPVRFNVNVQSIVSVINTSTNQDAGQTINIQQAINAQTNSTKLFATQPWAIAFKNSADHGYVVSAASNIVVKLAVNTTTGAPSVQSDPSDSTKVLEIPVGKNPRGIVINSGDTRAYVWNYISRDVSVIDLTQSPEKVVATLASTALPATGTADDKIHAGRELFFTSVGVFDPPAAGQAAVTGRMSMNGWGSCSVCHPNGLTDNSVWIFASGPRRTVPLHSTFAHGDATQQRALNWSGILDQVESFEANIRNVSGGAGLFVQADGVTPATLPAAFVPTAGLNQLKIRGVNSWDAIKAYIQSIPAPISPVSKTDLDVVAGQALFTQAGCHNCHGTVLWTTSRVRYTPPADPSLIQNTELIAELRPVGTFNQQAANEVRATAAAPLGTDGFNTPSLLSIFAFAQTFFHGGLAASFDDVLSNVVHRTAGLAAGASDPLTSATARVQLEKFLNSIDGNTPAINPPAPGSLTLVNNFNYKGSAEAPAAAVAAYGTGLASATAAAPSTTLPSRIGGTTVAVKDSAGVLRLAPLYGVSSGQVNFEMNPGTATGPAAVTVTAPSGATSSATVQIATVAPGIASSNPNGTGVAFATAFRLAADGVTQTPVTVFVCPSGGCTAAPIDVSTGTVFVSFYGTGIRGFGSLANVTCTIGGTNATVLSAGAQGQFAGLDQVNVQVPASLQGAGTVTVVFSVNGQAANPVTISIK
jgi:uncharacterized protein (TIGR03437 family)